MRAKPRDPLHDRVLIDRRRAGDDRALQELVSRRNRRLRYFVARLIDDDHNVEDILQDTWTAHSLRQDLGLIFQLVTYTHLIWAACLLVASILTIKLILASRRATLRQIQTSLAEITDQLRQAAAPRA